ncbi:ABC transporter ATP-binding protein [Limimaricola pyoseonensis]|uniref:Spermidine/putrescine import ATP-binding protein PotA n=1 Tax=Limimaricola pyoseonensis TaxID=521013 RepID=A0A1G7IIP0_9RHOB|nr:ABC transporter ATP-binding protein [Limimaricola pyoseonensis]SDF12572.1 spermidine/putrescine transport system ATP-binding protein [Limimaricola pyoseonensis]
MDKDPQRQTDRARQRPAIAARRLTKRFGPIEALKDLSLDIRENEFFTLLGPSGCGKTTLLRLIAGFELPTTGRIELDGEDISGLPPHRRPVNTVFQNYALFPHMTVAENVGFGLKMLGRSRSEIARRSAEMLELVELGAMAGRRVEQLSGGQQQRVALARALAPAPRVLLLDEPLAALDLKLRKAMQLELKKLQAETGITFVFVTHDQEEALTMSDRIAVMRAGEVLQVGSPAEIYDRPAHRFVADFIGEINILEGRIERMSREGHALVRLGGGAEIEARLDPELPRHGAVSVAVRPEGARLAGAEEAATIEGRLEHVVYFGSGSHIHLRLASGEPFVLRHSGPVDPQHLQPGARLGACIAPEQARVLA